MPQRIAIRPLDTGWVLEAQGAAEPMVFASGAKAEQAGRSLAERLALAGRSAEIVIELRDGSIAARFVTTARDSVDEPQR